MVTIYGNNDNVNNIPYVLYNKINAANKTYYIGQIGINYIYYHKMIMVILLVAIHSWMDGWCITKIKNINHFFLYFTFTLTHTPNI